MGKREHDGKQQRRMEEWLDRYPPPGDQARANGANGDDQHDLAAKKQLRAMAPQAVLDLHGFTSAEAISAINRFIKESVDAGLRKVMIVHGKGTHSPQGGVLAKVTSDCVSRHTLAGENGLSRGRDGGRGARWVILRQRSR